MTNSNKTFHETNDFAVEVGVGAFKGMPWEGQPCYRLRNKLTGVVEAEGPNLSVAIRAVHEHQARLERTKLDPAGENEPALEVPGFGPVDPTQFH